jgi:hypothetical protein
MALKDTQVDVVPAEYLLINPHPATFISRRRDRTSSRCTPPCALLVIFFSALVITPLGCCQEHCVRVADILKLSIRGISTIETLGKHISQAQVTSLSDKVHSGLYSCLFDYTLEMEHALSQT